MKNKILTLILVLSLPLVSVAQQKTYIPDDNFEQALINLGYDNMLDDSVITANINVLGYLNVSNQNISDLTGIESFTSLNTLKCQMNQLTSLDVSNNGFLVNLECWMNQLTSLDVRNGNNTNMSNNNFACSSNPLLTCIQVDNAASSTALWTNIDPQHFFSNNCAPGLTYVPDDNFEQELINLGYDNVLDDSITTANINSLTSLNLSNTSISDLTGIEDFTALTDLICPNNLLSVLDLSNNSNLATLLCYNNQLTSLDISNCSGLVNLNCGGNQLSNLNISNNSNLVTLKCNSNQLINLNVSMNTALADLDCSWNNLTSLDVRNNNNTNFTYFSTFNNSALSCIDVDDSTYSANNWSNISSQSYFSNNCSQLQQVKTYIPDDNFEQKLINLGYDNVLDDSITTASINSISSLFIQNSSISDLTGIEDFTALSKLWCFNNQLTNLDLSSNTSLIELSCGQNNIVNLDLTNNTALKKLYCSSNQISNLSVSSNVALAELLCSGNQLTSLDVSNNTSLTELDCSLNNIISIDLSNNTSLTYFKVGFNPPLSFLDLTGVSCSLISNLSSFYRTPNLTCIRVTDVNCWNALNLSSFILNQHYYSTNCPPPSGIEEQFINNELISITDILGKETPYKKNTPLFYLYDDGTVEKKIVVE